MPSEESSRDQDREQLLGEIAQGADKTFRNAEQLFREASLLDGAGALNRALFLHQISMEECAKIDILGAWAASLLTGEEVNTEKLAKALANHKAKNYTNAYMLEPTDEEKEARKRADYKGAGDAFKKLQAEFHLQSNTAKNASLYVDFSDGRFVAPDERITKEMVASIRSANEEFLGFVQPKVRMLLQWQAGPGDIEKTLVWLTTRAEELRSQMLGGPERVIATLMQELRDREMSKLKKKRR